MVVLTADAAHSQASTFTEGSSSYTIPSGTTQLVIQVSGAAGASTGSAGGQGGQVQATFAVGGSSPLQPGSVLQVNVGGAGQIDGGGYNGGAEGGHPSNDPSSGGGGGASDVRLCENTSCPLTSRFIVAGGGGGAGAAEDSGTGGEGGDGQSTQGGNGEDGGEGQPSQCDPGGGGTSTSGGGGGSGCKGGAASQGGHSGGLGTGGAGRGPTTDHGFASGGGGGGYYGGGGGGAANTPGGGDDGGGGGGGGGSSYVDSRAQDVQFGTADSSSNQNYPEGQVIIEAVGASDAEDRPAPAGTDRSSDGAFIAMGLILLVPVAGLAIGLLRR